MPLYRATRSEVLAGLADDFLHNYGRGRTTLAVDGIDGAGKTTFADALTDVLRERGATVFRASIDDFHRPRAERYAHGRTGESFYRDAYDYAVFRRVLIEPFRSRAADTPGFVLAVHDVDSDAALEPKWTTGPEGAILVVDGIFLNRPELSGLWNYSIWLDVPVDVAYARVAERDGTAADPTADSNRRYVEGQERYLAAVDPRAKAVAIVDNRDLEHPRRVFADSC